MRYMLPVKVSISAGESIVVDELLDSYLRWREACEDVRTEATGSAPRWA